MIKNETLTDDILFEIPESDKLGYLENLLRKANKGEKVMYNILVVDDDKEIVKAIEIYLEKENGVTKQIK